VTLGSPASWPGFLASPRPEGPGNIIVRMQTKFETHNFRSIDRLSLRMRPFMVFVGPDGAAKTNIIRATELFGETLYRAKDNDKGKAKIFVDYSAPSLAAAAAGMGSPVTERGQR